MRISLKEGARRVELVTSEGKVIGRVTALEVELSRSVEQELGVQEKLPIDTNVVNDIHAHWAALMSPRNKALDDESRRIIRGALKVATAEECRQAITGCHSSDFHMKRGEFAGRSGSKYNALSQILKGKRGGRTTREQIDFFIDIARRAPMLDSNLSDDPVRIRDAKRDVLAAHEFPDDEHTARRGIEAREWLQERGWVIGAREEDSWPTFTPPPTQTSP